MPGPSFVLLPVAVAAFILAGGVSGSAQAADGPLKLRCEGEGRKAVAQTSRSYSSRNGSETYTALRDRARVRLPDNLVPDLRDGGEDG